MLLAAGWITWWLAGLLISRAAAARLPAMPDRSTFPAAVADDILAADAAARRNATSAAAVGELGMAYHAGLRREAALQAYAVAEALAPNDWRWPYYRGLLLNESGNHEAAAGAFTKVVNIAPEHGLSRFHLAEIAFKTGRLDDAESAYRAARDAAGVAPPATPPGVPPRRSIALSAHCDFGLARIRLERGQREAARQLLSEVVATFPAFGSAHALLREVTAGTAHRDDGRAYVPPGDPWLDAIVIRSRHTDLLLKHAALAARSGDAAWRAWLASRAVEADPSGLDVLLEMASVLQDAGRHTEALDLLRRAETAAPRDHHTLVEQGQSLLELGRLDEAEQVLRRAVGVRDASAEYNLAAVLDAQGRWDEARQHYERALSINPFHARALNNLGIGLAGRGKVPEAIMLYRRAIDAAPTSADAYTNLAAALIARRQFEEALAALSTAVQLDPRQANPHNNRGIVLALTGRSAEARAAFETALRLDPSHADARRNLAALTVGR